MQLTFALAYLALLLPVLQVTAAPRAAPTQIPRLQPVRVTPKKSAAAVPVPTKNVFKGQTKPKPTAAAVPKPAAAKPAATKPATNQAKGGKGKGTKGNNGAANTSAAATSTEAAATSTEAAATSSAAEPAATTPAANLSADELQSSLSLSADLVQPASARTGQEENPTDGQVESITSVNNFINYCATKPDLALTNGEQNFAGSCNGIIMGEIMAKDKMPSAKVLFPANGATIQEGEDINFQIKVRNIQTGSFTNAQRTYYSAPAQLNNQGLLIGHQHITVNAEPSLDNTEPLDPQDFVFFKGLNDPAVNDVLSATAVGGLTAGFYRACTLGSSANHTPIIPPVAQRASGEDCIRFEVVAAGQGNNNANAGAADANAGNANANAGNANAGNANAGNANANAGNANANANAGKGKGRGRQQGQRRFSPARRSRAARK